MQMRWPVLVAVTAAALLVTERQAQAVSQVTCTGGVFVQDPAVATCGSFPALPNDPPAAGAAASADLTTGELKAYASGDSGSFNVQALTNDFLSIDFGGAPSAVLDFLLTVDGSVLGPTSGSSLQVFLGLTTTDTNAIGAGYVAASYAFLDINDPQIFDVGFLDLYSTPSASKSIVTDARDGFEVTLGFSHEFLAGDDPLNVLMGLNMFLSPDGGTAVGDISNTATLTITAPDGVSVTSANGLLSNTAAVPVPAPFGLLLAALGGLALLGRQRIRA